MSDEISTPPNEEPTPVTPSVAVPPSKPPISPAPASPPPPPAPPTIDIEAAVTKALDARESKVKDSEWRSGIEKKLDDLSKPKKRKWFEPWTLFNG